MRRLAIAMASFATAIGARPARAQSLASRVDAVRDGIVEFRFAARPAVCGDGTGNSWSTNGAWSRGNGRSACITGPVRITIGRADNQTVSVRLCVACAVRAGHGGDVDLGDIAPDDAARYLISLARHIAGTSAGDAVAGASIADANVAPEFQALVRDDDASVDARKQGLFWFGQSDASTHDVIGVYDSLKPQELRRQFVFVVSQRQDDESVDKLIDIAQHDRDGDVRKQAMFWLGQSKQPKAIKFFQTILTR